MNPTHDQDNTRPDTRTAPGGTVAGELAALLTDDTRFRTWIAQAVATATPHTPANSDGYVVTDAGMRALDEATPAGAPGTVAQVLRSAALYLERHGWIQGAYYDMAATVFTPAADLVGAIGMVCYGGPCEAPAQHFDDPGFLDFEEAVLHLDRWLLVHDGSESYEFNDAQGRRAEDVLRALREAADTPADELVDALRAAHLCPRCRTGCPGNDYNGYADPGAFGYCGCLCHTGNPGGGAA